MPIRLHMQSERFAITMIYGFAPVLPGRASGSDDRAYATVMLCRHQSEHQNAFKLCEQILHISAAGAESPSQRCRRIGPYLPFIPSQRMTDEKSHGSTDIDYEEYGFQKGALRVPHPVDRFDYRHIPIAIAVLKGGAGPTVLLTGGTQNDEYEGPVNYSSGCRRST
jgi:hypothetical protein